ncbi:GMP synthase [Halopseudomonas laoshanensis]|uniref:GMP synthase n=1 Tax=Halopseudomonas laoshanensis TaxID=2268758 RepID=A0A7V7GXC7_9GAMM|nr:gamma-glutamyl-gamma-aminobutyrate hydrolase family protein [Halopseudomonas laoshanensis]KAA0696705.1 GMP synthase [Halopseudomonas laoshanensis]
MKIGLLQCDDVMESLQVAHGNYPEMFNELLLARHPDAQIRVYRCMDGELPQDLNECDAYITSGSKFGVNDGLPWIDALQECIARMWEQGTPLVGVCFGHQLMAKALGGEVIKSPKGWGVGMSFNQVLVRKSWMKPWQDKLDLVVSHQDQVSLLPPQAEILASSEFCPYYLVQYGQHFMSVQGHPEFCKSYSRDLMDARRGVIAHARLREGQASLSAEVDAPVMSSWIINFMQEALAG